MLRLRLGLNAARLAPLGALSIHNSKNFDKFLRRHPVAWICAVSYSPLMVMMVMTTIRFGRKSKRWRYRTRSNKMVCKPDGWGLLPANEI